MDLRQYALYFFALETKHVQNLMDFINKQPLVHFYIYFNKKYHTCQYHNQPHEISMSPAPHFCLKCRAHSRRRPGACHFNFAAQVQSQKHTADQNTYLCRKYYYQQVYCGFNFFNITAVTDLLVFSK